MASVAAVAARPWDDFHAAVVAFEATRSERGKEAVRMSSWDGRERRVTPDPALLAVAVESMQSDLKDVKDRLGVLADAMTRLAVFEERQARYSDTMAELRKHSETLQERVRTLESAGAVNESKTDTVTKWVEWGIVALVGAAASYLAVQAGVMPV